jgi:hypothetical protein
MSVTQPFQAAPSHPVFTAGPDQIQGRDAAVSSDGATFCASRRLRRNPEKRHEKLLMASVTDPRAKLLLQNEAGVGTVLRIISH